MKFVPQSEWRQAEPRSEVNLLQAFIKLEEERDSSTSIRTTLVTRLVKMTTQHFFSAGPPWICLVPSFQEPETVDVMLSVVSQSWPV